MDPVHSSAEKLGRLTLLLLVMQSLAGFFGLIVLTAIYYFGISYVPPQFTDIARMAGPVLVTLDLLAFLFGLVVGYMEYLHYNVIISAEGLTILRGVISVEETAIPFRRIKEVKQNRSLVDQIIGSSTLLITVVGEEEAGQSAPIVLQNLSKEFAELVQNKTMSQVEFEQVDVKEGEMPAGGSAK